MERIRLISVIGAGSPGQKALEDARQVGRLLAGRGYGVVSGGLGGVMQAASKGCAEAGGFVLGIVPTTRAADANPYCSVVVPTGMGQARNLLVVLSGLGAIAVAGGAGTLSEIGHALKAGRPVVSLGSWKLDQVPQAQNPDQAVELLLSSIE